MCDPPNSYLYGSGLRARKVEQTIEIAKQLAKDLGIVRVTDTTRLDRVGIPVFASIRPNAVPGSLCVSAGKGLTADEARAGAYMEAIELAWAEHRRALVDLVRATPRDVLDGRTRPDAVYDFGIMDGGIVDMDAPIDCVEATDLISGEQTLVPAELVLFPMPQDRGSRSVFGGSHGNGLCSGNTVDEATVHGLAELIERDVMAFTNTRDETRRIVNETLPDPLREIAARLARVGFDLYVRHQPNQFGLPWVVAALHEHDAKDGFHIGYGCNPSRAIAATRAVVEAAQGRLTIIHGGRDDLPTHFRQFAALSATDRRELFRRMAASVASGDPTQCDDFGVVADRSSEARDIPSALATLLQALVNNGFSHVLRVVYTPADYPIQVVRVLVPGLEVSTAGIRQVGRRLKEFRKRVAKESAAVRGADPVES